MWDFFKTIVVSGFISGGTAWLILTYLGKKIVEQRLEKDIEKFKIELTQKSEVLKTNLAIHAHEQTTAIARVDNQRAEAIKRIYAAIRGWMIPVHRLVSDCPLMDADEGAIFQFFRGWAEDAHNKGKDLATVLADEAIYLDEETYSKLAKVVNMSLESVASYLLPIREGEVGYVDYEDIAEGAEIDRKKLTKLYIHQIGPLYSEITNDFRILLGVVKKDI